MDLVFVLIRGLLQLKLMVRRNVLSNAHLNLIKYNHSRKISGVKPQTNASPATTVGNKQSMDPMESNSVKINALLIVGNCGTNQQPSVRNAKVSTG